jgi:hypothetical protein
MGGPFQPTFVMDEKAYREKRKELEEEVAARVKARGTPMTLDDIRYYTDGAAKVAYNTEFSVICTQAIRGNWEPAKERCRREREEKGEEIARELMRSYQRAVKAKQRLIDGS